MRVAFLHTLTEIMRKDDSVITITADMGYSVFENLQKEFPKRFFNTGVTEQSSMSIASGLALSGYTVFFYAQAPFATMRCFEQIRLDVAYAKTNVKIIGTASGLASNQLGTSHFALEDIALMRQLPNMTVFSPGDSTEAQWATITSYKLKGPTYIRLSKNGSLQMPKHATRLTLGKGRNVQSGNDITLLVTGNMLDIAYEVTKQLASDGITVSLISMPTLKPIDRKLILSEAKKTKKLVTLEEHSIIGGLGSATADILSSSGVHAKLLIIGFPDKFIDVTGSIEYLRASVGLSKEKIYKQIKKEFSFP